VHKLDVIAQTVYTKCAKLVDEQNNQLLCCVSVRDFEPKILIKHLTNLKKELFDRKLIYFL